MSNKYLHGDPLQLHRECGFTLIEVMITVFVMAIGLLGIAGMQSVGIRESQNTYFRSQAYVLADDMAARIMTNRSASVEDADNPYGNAPGGAPDCNTANCTPAQMAAFDLEQWTATIQGSSKLPQARGDVTQVQTYLGPDNNPVGAQYAVQVFWDEEREGSLPAVGTDCDTATMACVRLLVQVL